MRRGFVYNTGQQRTRQQGQRGGASQSAYPSLQMSSPRKRKRSPENPASGQRGPKAVKPKSSFEDDSDGDLDELGTAALEEFELTQREGNKSPSPIPEPVSQFHAPIGRPNQPSYPTAATSIPVSNRSQRWPNPYDKKETPQVSGFQNQPSTLGGQSQNGRTMKVSPPPDTEYRYKEEIHQLQARNQQLLEQNYTRDGEVKVLRNEKERMVGELRKKEGLMHELHTRLLSEQQAKEQQMTKENQSLMTQLKFKEQELLDLQGKLAIIEQKQKLPGQSIAQPSPVPPSRAPLKMTSGSKSKLQTLGQKMEFLSTETFMPLSQLSSSDVTAVHVQQRIGPQSEQGSTDGTTKQKTTVPSIETSPIAALAPKNHQENEDITTPASTSVPEAHVATSARQESPSKSTTPDQKDPPVVLDIPSIGSDLVMLLVQHDLLKVPKFKAEEGVVSADQHTTSLEVSPPVQPLHKLTGLLSLLHIPVQDSASSLTFSHALTTPVSRLRSEDVHSFTGGSLKPMPSLDSSTEMTPKTPIRRPRIQPLKSLTCARSDLSRARMRQIPPGKSLSAANTPIRDNLEQQMVSSLASSINKSGLEQSIASLLRSTDSSKVSTMFKSLSRICKISPSPTVSRKPIRSDASCVYMLQHIGDIIVKYYNEQLVKVRAVFLSGEHVPDLGENFENSIQSPKSSLSSSSTTSSRISQDFSPAPADQELVSQLLSALETLTTYSRCVREQLLAEPPEFHIDSGPPSVMEAESTSTDDDEACMEVEVHHTSKEQGHIARSYSDQAITQHQQATPTLQSGSVLKERKEWEGVQLVQLKSNSGCKVWVPEAATESRSIPRSSYQHTPLHRALRGTEKIFPTLLELTAPGPWRESVENTVSCLNILSSLAEDCPVGSLERFSPLLLDDSIDVCLEEREDSLITMATLRLLTHMVKSPAIVTLLCRQGDNCTLLTCYQCFLDPPSDTTHNIHIQLLRLISNILLVSEGPKVLFESSVCSCSHELLKSLVTLLNCLIRDVHEPKQLSHQHLSLVCELVSALHKISIQDRDYDTHREKCLHPLTFVLNTLSWLLKAIPTTQAEVVLVNDLLESCEESDDSQENSERMDER